MLTAGTGPLGILAPRTMRENFDDAAPVLLEHVRLMARHHETARVTPARVEAYGVPTAAFGTSFPLPVVVLLVLLHSGVRLSFFSTMTMLGTATDTVLASLRLETLFPADDATEVAIHRIGQQ